jgi:hypothetical protein
MLTFKALPNRVPRPPQLQMQPAAPHVHVQHRQTEQPRTDHLQTEPATAATALHCLPQAEPGLFEQYPFNCHVVRQVSKGSVKKVMAAKAYWRTNTGNHYVVEADMAKEYFGGAEPGARNPRWGLGLGFSVVSGRGRGEGDSCGFRAPVRMEGDL